MTDTIIKSEETWHPLIGTSKVFFDEGDRKYSVRSCGPRYLVAVNARPGKVGRIIIPDTYRPSETAGFIVDLGDGYLNEETGERIPPPLQIGDMVLFSHYAGTKVTLGGREFVLMPYDSVIGVLTPEGPVTDDDEEDH